MNAGRQMKAAKLALLLGLLALGACGKRPTDPVTPRADAAAPGGTLPVTPSAPDPSVPSATSVLSAPVTGTAKDEVAAKVGSNESMTRTQESNAMPMPGQVNNHSTTALDPANTRRAASAP
jgi:hypothetical protein